MMRKVLFFFAFAMFALSCTDTPDQATTDMLTFPDEKGNFPEEIPEMTFESTELEFGKVLDGDLVEHTFEFVNTGKAPLILSAVEPSCGCTVPKSWPKNPVLPGETGKIEVTFDSKNRVGKINKTITVIANTAPANTILKLTGEVVGPTP